jgi:transcription elongation factor GreA
MRIPTRKPGTYADLRRDPHMTQAKYEELQAQLARLLLARPDAANEVKRLAEMGDFSENAAYQLAKGKLRSLNQRILEIEDHLKHSEIIYPTPSATVQLGSTVTFERAGQQHTFKILGPTETNPAKGIISHKSPLGAALVGKQEGDTVHFIAASKESTVKILHVE